MGCYGIGVTRVVAAAIEQNNDDKGIIWPAGLAPFQIGIVPMNYDKSALVKETADRIYQQLSALGIEVLMDDRDKKTSPGVKFADMDLIGIPHRLVISERGLKENQIEYQERRSQQRQDLVADEAVAFVQTQLSS
jgi:prolyl-tRNA synthetase